MKRIFFVTGMPRSGTRLLMSVLAQNNQIHAAIPSGLLEVLFSNRNGWGVHPEHAAIDGVLAETKRLNVFRAILASYHQEVEEPIVADFSRGWAAYINFISYILGPDTSVKLIMCVRDLREILASLERLYQNASRFTQWPGEAENYFLFQSARGRCQYWFQNDQLVGLAFNRVAEAIRLHSSKLYIMHYSQLCQNPKRTLDEIYNFLEMEAFQHDFDNVAQVTPDRVDVYGIPGLHQIRPKIEVLRTRKQTLRILGSVANEYQGPYPWSDV